MNRSFQGNVEKSYHVTPEVLKKRDEFFELFKSCPIPQSEILSNLGLFTRRQILARTLYLNDLYKRIVNVPGAVLDFGTRWGQNMVLFSNFRDLYEAHNLSRQIVGFDTFEGFKDLDKKDGEYIFLKKGNYSTSEKYENYLEDILDYHASEGSSSNLKRHTVLRGDAPIKLKEYLDANQHTLVALAYFDMDLYLPTKACLEMIKPLMPKGAVLAFDEVNWHEFPGETLALKEVFGIEHCALQRSEHSGATQCFMVI